MPHRLSLVVMDEVRDDPYLPGDTGELLISDWSGWRFDLHYETFSLLDGNKLARQVRKPRASPPTVR